MIVYAFYAAKWRMGVVYSAAVIQDVMVSN